MWFRNRLILRYLIILFWVCFLLLHLNLLTLPDKTIHLLPIFNSFRTVVSSAVSRLERPVTVVTAYFKIPSKQTDEIYREWMANFLPIIPCHLYIVTDSESASEVERLRADFPNETKVIVKSFSDLIEAKRMTMWVEQTQLDHEKHHTPELYVIWNEKVHLLMEAIEENPFDSDYFLWTDIGCFRDAERAEKLTSYPDTYTTSSLLGTNNVFFLQVGNFRQEHQIIGENGLPINHFQYDVCLGGGVFGGHANAVRQYSQQYYKTMDLMQSNGIFIGKDQNVMSTVAVLYPNLVKLVKPQYYLDGADPWFYSLHYFSKRTINETIPG